MLVAQSAGDEPRDVLLDVPARHVIGAFVDAVEVDELSVDNVVNDQRDGHAVEIELVAARTASAIDVHGVGDDEQGADHGLR